MTKFNDIETVKEVIGHGNLYIYGVDVAVAHINRRLINQGILDWRVGYNMDYSPVPEGAVQIGQVRVRCSDAPYPLWVRQESRA